MHFQDLPYPPPNGPLAPHGGFTPQQEGCHASGPQLFLPKDPLKYCGNEFPRKGEPARNSLEQETARPGIEKAELNA